MKHAALLALAVFVPEITAAEPIFPNSVVSNNIDFITTQDPSAFYCLTYFGTETREMPDKRSSALFADDVHIFEAWFTDGTAIELTVHPDLGDETNAEQVARKLVDPLGRLPSFMRDGLSHVVILQGDLTAFAESEGRFFTVYDANVASRISTHDLEETVFHEAVHAIMDVPIARDPEWLRAQTNDGAFVTDYGASSPQGEDLAETALFAFTYFQHPERLPTQVKEELVELVPHKLEFLERFFGPSQDMQRTVDGLENCGR